MVHPIRIRPGGKTRFGFEGEERRPELAIGPAFSKAQKASFVSELHFHAARGVRFRRRTGRSQLDKLRGRPFVDSFTARTRSSGKPRQILQGHQIDKWSEYHDFGSNGVPSRDSAGKSTHASNGGRLLPQNTIGQNQSDAIRRFNGHGDEFHRRLPVPDPGRRRRGDGLSQR